MKRINLRRTSALLLALLAVGSAMASCGDAGTASPAETEAKKTDNTAVTGAVTEAVTEEPTGDPDSRDFARTNLPAELDFGGEEVRLLTRAGDDFVKIEFIAEEQTGDIVEDAVYKRNSTVSEKLNLTLTVIPTEDDHHGSTSVADIIKKSVTAGDDEYDLIGNHMSQNTTNMVAGVFLNFADIDYIDWERPWWNHSYNELITIDGKQYAAAGELGLTMISDTYITFFNKTLWNNYYPDDNLYQVVLDGKWTIDKMTDYCKEVYRDTNGNGTADADDIYGSVFINSANAGIQADAMSGAAMMEFSRYDESTGYYVWALENERSASFAQKVRALLYENNNTYQIKEGNYDLDLLPKLMDDTALFVIHSMYGAQLLRDMKSDYGIVPTPKLDEAQENYASYIHNGFTVFSIPKTCKKTDVVGAFMELACMESYKTVVPTYYDVALKVKYARDEEAGAMLDLAIGGIRFDFAYLFGQYLSRPTALFRTLFMTPDKLDSAMSKIATKEKSANAGLVKLRDAYDALD